MDLIGVRRIIRGLEKFTFFFNIIHGEQQNQLTCKSQETRY